ncbi:sialoadhesin-like [Aquarana catesbeiana]|uniref:sialoadhesin-like n=1 Tax=Aquarana catesbeiana TaxID=8400 RepID=UPI003CC94FB0
MLFLKGCFNGTLKDDYVELLDRVEVWKGSCAMLPCKYKPKDDFDKFLWYFNSTYDIITKDFNGTTVYNSKDENDVDPLFARRVQYVGKSDTDCTIVIRNIQKEDEGTYNLRLLTKNKAFRWMSKTLTIAVSDIGTTLKINPLPEIRESENVTLTCSISYYCPLNNISLHWIEDVNGTSTIDIRSDISEVRTTSTLMFQPSWRDNKKNITCVLNGDDGKADNTTVQLNVMYVPHKPVIKKYGETIEEGKDITLECSTEANPPVSLYVWLKDGAECYNRTSNRFTIYNIKEDNSGSYTCLARNKLGEAKSDQLDLNVTYAPRYPRVVLEPNRTTFAEKDKIIFVEGDKVIFRCDVNSSNPDVTNITWYKNGKNIKKCSESIKAEDAGKYTCEAENSVGRTRSPEVNVDIRYAPRYPRVVLELNRTRFAEKDKIIFVEGDKVIFRCDVNSSNPDVTNITWYKNGKNIKKFSESIKAEDAGKYTCEAENSVGRTMSPEVNVDIRYAPRYPRVVLELNRTRFAEKDKIIFVEGDKVIFRCDVNSSNPDVTNITWYKNGKNIKKFSESIKAEDAGKYTCEAENSVGRTRSPEVNVDIRYAPRYPRVVLELNRTRFAEKDKIIFVEGDKVIFRCDVNSSNPDVTNITWYKNGKNIKKFSESIKAEDAGKYTCEAENSVGRTRSPEVNVDIRYAPRYPRVVLELNRTRFAEKDKIIFVEGDKVIFRCDVNSSNPDVTNITWYKNGKNIKKFSESIKAEDAGKYTCEAENSVGRTMSPEVNVDIRYAPRYPRVVLEPNRTTFPEKDKIIFVEGDKVIFRCNVNSSNPDVTNIIWYKNGKNIKKFSESVKAEDAGKYTCEAENSVGRTRSPEVNVDIRYAPRYPRVVLELNRTRFAEKDKIIFVEGDKVIFRCDVNSSNPDVTNITWYKNGKNIKKFCESIKAEDAGKYTCEAENSVGRTMSPEVNVDIRYAPRYPRVVLELNRTRFAEKDKIIFVEGDKVIFRCDVNSSNPDVTNITWYKNGKNIKKFSESIKAEDAGKYTCEAENSVGRTRSPEVNVDIRYAPRYPRVVLELNRTRFAEKDKIIFVEGDKVIFRCDVNSSNPDVTNITWYKNGKNIKKFSESIKAEDAGKYTCEAENSVGRTMSPEVNVDIRYAPRYPRVVLVPNRTTFPEKDKIIFVEGDKVIFRCNVNSSNPDVTNIIWYKNGKNIKKFSESVKAEDAGKYTCEAENSVGRTRSPEVNVDIRYAPRYPRVVLELNRTRFAEKDKIIFVEGDKVIFRCDVNSINPDVTNITWYKNGKNIKKFSDSIKAEDAGKYTCEAENSVGHTRSPEVNVDIHYAPRYPRVVLELNRTRFAEEAKIIFVEGDKVIFRCDVNSSNPDVTNITWYKNGKNIKKFSESIKAEDAGKYTCEAENSVGRTRSPEVMVDVHYSPAPIVKFASMGTLSFISLLMLIILIVRFRVRIRNALCRRTVDDKGESSSFVLKKYKNIPSSERAHEDCQDGTPCSIIANLNEKDKERERDPEVEYASLGHS